MLTAPLPWLLQLGTASCYPTASQWVTRLADAHHAGTLQAELTRLGRYPLLVIDVCRHGDYADEAAVVGLLARRPGLGLSA